MKRNIVVLFSIVAVFALIFVLYSNLRIKRDVPVLVEEKNTSGFIKMTQADILFYDEVCSGIIYDISNDNDKLLVVMPTQVDPQTGLQTDKQYLSTNLYDSKTLQMKLFNFDMTDHVSACFDENLLGIYYISIDKNQDKNLMYTTIDSNKTKIVAGKEEMITTGVVLAGKYAVYGTLDGKIKIADSKDYKKILYDLGNKFSIKKIRYFIKSQICIVQTENKNNNQNPLFMIDTTTGDIKVIDVNIEDFDTNESGYSVVYISKSGQDDRQIYLYDISNNTRKFEKNGYIENVFFNNSGSAIVYTEKAKKEATGFNIGLIIKNGNKNIRIISDAKLSNKKLIFKGNDTIYFSQLKNKAGNNTSSVEHEYKVLKCIFSLSGNK